MAVETHEPREERSWYPTPVLDAAAIRQDFPLLARQVQGKPLVYLDNAATTQKPQVVIDRVTRFYVEENANVHRGVHWLSERATNVFEEARATVGRFVNARRAEEIVFVRGATEAINLVAQSYGRSRVTRGDDIVISAMEHHSNIVPWQILCDQQGARLRIIPITDAGELDLDAYATLLTDRTRMVSVVHVSNVLGTVNPVETIVRLAHQRGIPVLVDGAQAVAHGAVDVQTLGCDFYAFSGHKMFGPTGIGVLYGTSALLESMPPYQSGGDMIRSVSFEQTLYNVPPFRFEAGTPNIAGAVGLAAAIDYLTGIGFDRIARFERELLEYATGALSRLPGVRVIGTAAAKAGVLSFVVDGVHPHDVGTILDREGVAIRTGHHCCQPLMDRLGLPATARVSFALYNTREDIDALVAALQTVRALLG
jgi:cysteine desulfurase / selenocysteine lyase